MRYAELFAGAGGLSLGLDRAGWDCAFHAEIADFPRQVLRRRWPDTPLYGDVSELNGAELVADHGQIDLLSGGSPCQDLSVAGKRSGLTEGSGTRSSLFYEQIRIWKETGADLCLWENVDGARNSNKGGDFAAVLSAFVGAPVTVPGNGWRNSGVASGPAGVAAWRVFDARYFGVPQRRRRVFVLCSRTGRIDPGEILSLSESVSGDPPASRKKREEVARSAQEGAGTIAINLRNATRDKSIGRSASGIGEINEPAPTLLGPPAHAVFAFKPSHYTRGKDGAPTDVMPPLTADADRGDQEAVVFTFAPEQITHPENRSTVTPGQPASTLSGQPPAVFRMLAFGEYSEDGTASTIKSRDYKDATDLIVEPVMVNISGGAPRLEPVSSTLVARPGGTGIGAQMQAVLAGRIRRLLPIECERLMGWPDNWTNVPDEKGKPASDSVRYKACGNGVVSHIPEWIGRQILRLST